MCDDQDPCFGLGGDADFDGICDSIETTTFSDACTRTTNDIDNDGDGCDHQALYLRVCSRNAIDSAPQTPFDSSFGATGVAYNYNGLWNSVEPPRAMRWYRHYSYSSAPYTVYTIHDSDVVESKWQEIINAMGSTSYTTVVTCGAEADQSVSGCYPMSETVKAGLVNHGASRELLDSMVAGDAYMLAVAPVSNVMRVIAEHLSPGCITAKIADGTHEIGPFSWAQTDRCSSSPSFYTRSCQNSHYNQYEPACHRRCTPQHESSIVSRTRLC